MRETFNFAQRRRMAGLVRRPRSPADLPGNTTNAMQSLTFPRVAHSADAKRIALSRGARIRRIAHGVRSNASGRDKAKNARAPRLGVRYPIRAQCSEAE